MIVITAPTSRIGHQLLPLLRAANVPVRVIVRNAEKLSPEIRRHAEVVEGSHGDAAIIDRALKGATHLFWLCPANPKAASVDEAYVEFTRPAADAIKAHGVERVVDITALGRGTPYAGEAGYVTGSLAMDDLLAATGAHFRALAMPSFMDNLLWQVPVMRSKGMFFSPIPGDLALPACSVSDIAAVAARFLLDDTWEGQAEVPVLGPEDLSFNQMAAIMNEVLGHKITCTPVDFESYKTMFINQGFTEAMASGMTNMARAKSRGLDLGVTRTPKTATPTSFRQWCETVLKPAFKN